MVSAGGVIGLAVISILIWICCWRNNSCLKSCRVCQYCEKSVIDNSKLVVQDDDAATLNHSSLGTSLPCAWTVNREGYVCRDLERISEVSECSNYMDADDNGNRRPGALAKRDMEIISEKTGLSPHAYIL